MNREATTGYASATTIAELRSNITKGNVALYIAGDSEVSTAVAPDAVSGVDWLAIWSESRDPTLAQALAASSLHSKRSIIEITGRLQDSVGTHYSLADVCPYFFLSGRVDVESLPEREQRRARDEHIDEVLKLRSSPLVVVGATGVSAICQLLRELPQTLGNVIVLGVSEKDAVQLRAKTADIDTLSFAAWTASNLEDLISPLPERAVVSGEDAATQILLGRKLVSISSLLERAIPLDEPFAIITAADAAPPHSQEDTALLLDQMMSGRGIPWRALAHGLNWNRLDSFVNRASQEVQIAAERRQVISLNIEAETGSGVTTLLQRAAFECARNGFPTLYCRPESRRVDYALIREFAELVREAATEPTAIVVVFDVPDAGSDSRAVASQIPRSLSRDGYPALVIRAFAPNSRAGTEQTFQAATVPTRQALGRRQYETWWETPLSALLTPVERDSLCSWASAHWPIPTDRLSHVLRTWGEDWPAHSTPAPPLLTCLYFLLRDEVGGSVQLGSHLVNRVRAVVPAEARQPGRPDPNIEDLAHSLQEHFKPTRASLTTASKPTRSELGSTFMTLCAYSTLRLSLPISVLSKVAGIRLEKIGTVCGALEKAGLASSVFNVDLISSGMHSKGAYYSEEERIRLRHASFGRLALDWLVSDAALDDVEYFELDDSIRQVRQMLESGRLPDYPVKLLSLLLPKLSPTPSCIAFAEDITSQLLRFQRLRGSPYHEWLFSKRQVDTLLELLECIPEAVGTSSAVILHSKGLTRYKSCSLTRPLHDCRERYALASADLSSAYALATEDFSSEHPANIITSHGLLFMKWAGQERRRADEGGSESDANAYMLRAVDLLREGLRLRSDYNSYAAYGLAAVLIEGCQNSDPIRDPESFAKRLAEALALLQQEPDPAYLDEWEELQKSAVALLSSDEADEVIKNLQAAGSDLASGFAALRTLEGVIPMYPTGSSEEGDRIRAAWEQLGQEREASASESPLADLLRYATFSALSERVKHPAFQERFNLLAKLSGSSYLEDPVWLFDYAMLSFQLGDFQGATTAFSELRRGARFFRVPRDRFQPYYSSSDPLRRRRISFRVISASADGKAWARVVEPAGIQEPVPVASAKFRETGRIVRAGEVLPGCLILRAAGPMAEPLPSGHADAP